MGKIGKAKITKNSKGEENTEYVLLKRWWWYWCMLCYICMYMESDPKPKESRHCH